MPVARAAFVTGATRGIGWAIASHLAQRGYGVTMVGRDKIELERRCALVVDDGGAAVATLCDLRRATDIECVVQTHLDTWGRLDVLVNSAGVLVAGPIDALDVEALDELLDVN